jgi:DNA-binding response OmpR family regulator
VEQGLGSVEERLKILVVEDDPVYAEFVAGTMRQSGHDADIAVDGATARAMSRALQPDAVILDLGLPDESGYDLARALRAGVLPQSSVIIVLTANLYPQRDVADAVGVDVVLSKPVEPALVTGMIDHVRERRRRRLSK